MLKTAVFVFFLYALLNFAIADDSEVEHIEVLAPKPAVLLSTGRQTIAYLDDDYRFDLNRTIADRLVAIPGVSLNGQGGQFQSYGIRGFSRARILTEIDGIPIITDRRAGNSVSFVAPDLLTHGQVIKGPSSAIYGSQAMGGVVSLTSEMQDGAELNLSGQSNNQAVSLTAKHQQDGLTSAFAYQHANNDNAPAGQSLNTRFERFSGLLKLNHQLDELAITLSWLPSYGQDIGKSNVKYPDSELSHYPEEIHSLAQVQMRSNSGWLAKFFHHYQNWDNETRRIDQYDALTAYQNHTLGGQGLIPINLTDAESYFGVDWLARKGVSITSHYNFFAQQAESSELFANEVVGTEDNLALFSKTIWQWRQATFGLGIRYDWIKQQSDGQPDVTDAQLNASLSVNMPVNEDLALELDVANGFRYPTLSERYFNGRTPRGFVTGSQDLKPETSLGGQVGLNWQGSELFSVQGTFYYYDLDDYIERFERNEGQLSYRNLDEASIYGFEAQLQWYLSEYSEHRLTYQQQGGEDKDGQRLADLHPKALEWTLLINYHALSVANAISYTFDADEVGSSELERESFLLWNLSLDYQLEDNHSLSLTINNVSNQSYYASLDADAQLQPERSVRLSSRWRF